MFNLMLNQIYLKRKIPFELSSTQLTENGYTTEFEARFLAEAEELYKSVDNGTTKVYKNTAEMFAVWDKEKDHQLKGRMRRYCECHVGGSGDC